MENHDPRKKAERDAARKKDMVPEPPMEAETSVPETKRDELITNKSVEDPTRNGSRGTWFWLPVGAAIGAAIGVATDNLGVWLTIGVVLGFILSMVGSKKVKHEDKQD